jgi:CheY-like chemotaxis protein
VKSADRRLAVLVVDDDPGDVLLIQEALELAGNDRDIHIAADGAEAISFLERTGDHAAAVRPDVVLLDLNMPGKNGRQVLAQIKANPGLRSIPILVFSTSQDPVDIEASYSLHANAYVPKPINFDDFTSVVARIDNFFTQVACLPTAS